MGAQHTPGPWNVTPGFHGDDRMYISAQERPGLIATVAAYRAELEVEANANLIAASPDLLTQLQGLLAATRLVISAVGIDPESTNVDFRANGQPIAKVLLATLLANADAAVAKAEGR